MSEKYSAADAKRIIKAEEDFKPLNPDLSTLKPNGLKTVRSTYTGLKHQPSDIPQQSPAGVLFYNLQLCYQHQKNVSEGCIKDLLWGFRQSGIPSNIVMDGFTELYRLRYLSFTTPEGTAVLGTFNEKCWFKWDRKFFDLLMEDGKVSELLISDSIKPEDKTVDDLKD